jgi:hypothetical protein
LESNWNTDKIIKISSLIALLILMCVLVHAETTFFDNPDDIFIMINQEQEKDQSPSKNFKKLNDPLSEINNKTEEKNITNNIIKESREETPSKDIWVFAIIILIFFVCVEIFKHRKTIKDLIRDI